MKGLVIFFLVSERSIFFCLNLTPLLYLSISEKNLVYKKKVILPSHIL